VAGTWTFRVDGRLTPAGTPRRPPDAAPSLKAFRGSDVVFDDVRIRRFPARCRLSIILTCHRFLQRLRVVLAAWCRQDAPSGSIEVIVVNPASPDGTSEHLAAVAASYPQVRVRELFVDAPAHKPILINKGVRASSGDWIWLTDADCLFPTSAASVVLRELDRIATSVLLYGGRQHLRRDDTEALLAMALDGVADFAALERRADAHPSELYPWGYTQIVRREVLLRTPYREDIPHFAHSDGAFVEACRRRGIPERPVPGLRCLHLDHPFAWYGTDAFC
jgi:glycosyltransferase involved in cell wall biosynthesis